MLLGGGHVTAVTGGSQECSGYWRFAGVNSVLLIARDECVVHTASAALDLHAKLVCLKR